MNTPVLIFQNFVKHFIEINGFLDDENFLFSQCIVWCNQYAFWILQEQDLLIYLEYFTFIK